MKKVKLNFALSFISMGIGMLSFAQPPKDIDTGPSWSTDGRKIGFASTRNGKLDVYTVNPDGSPITQLTSGTGGSNQYQVWSPDGKKILFASNRDGNPEIYVMDADGKNQKNLTNNAATEEGRAGWFPNGKEIVFTSDRNGSVDLYTMDADGSNVVQITNDAAIESSPSVSPDSKKIIYTSHIEGVGGSVYIIDVNTGNKKVLAEDGSYPSWSMDGKKIVFQSNRDGKSVANGRIPAPEIYIMDADGSNQKNISNNDFWDFYCYFSPDGKSIVFTSMRDGNQEIYTMTIDGSNVKRITNN